MGLTDTVKTFPDGRPLLPGYVSHLFLKLQRQADLRVVRFHDLRHSCGSLLLKQGVPMRVIQEILGHASITTTMGIYGHIDAEMQDAAAAAMDRAISDRDRSQ